jgi:hypothetical protein
VIEAAGTKRFWDLSWDPYRDWASASGRPPFDLNLGDMGAGHLLLTSAGEVRFFWAGH